MTTLANRVASAVASQRKATTILRRLSRTAVWLSIYLLMFAVPAANGADEAKPSTRLSRQQRARVTAVSKQLTEIGRALVDYEATWEEISLSRKHHPQEMFQENGVPKLSWRVHLLPFVGESQLYNRFKRDEPWNSPHNKALLRDMPDAYRLPGDPRRATTTRIRAIRGRVVDGKPTSVFATGASLRFEDITDGMANTVMLVEAGSDRATPWTKPECIDFDPEDLEKSLGKVNIPGRSVLFADGTAAFLKQDVDGDSWSKLIHPQDGARIGRDSLILGAQTATRPSSRNLGRVAAMLEEWKRPEGPLYRMCVTSDCSFMMRIDFDRVREDRRTAELLKTAEKSIPDIRDASFDQLSQVVFWLSDNHLTIAFRFKEAQSYKQASKALDETGCCGPLEFVQVDDRTFLSIGEETAKELLSPNGDAGPVAARILDIRLDSQVSVITGQLEDQSGLGYFLQGKEPAAKMIRTSELVEVHLDTGHRYLVRGLIRLESPETANAGLEQMSEVLSVWRKAVKSDVTLTGVLGSTEFLKVPEWPRCVVVRVTNTEGLVELISGRVRQAFVVAEDDATDVTLRNNLKGIGVAFHNFAAAYGTLPPSGNRKYLDSTGKPFLSWRVHLLPYLDQEPLYREFKLDEPWDSPHNKALLDRMPDIFETPGASEPDHTSIMTFTGKGTPFGNVPGPKLRSASDGLDQTILVVRAGPDKAVPWTKPVDLPLEAKSPLSALSTVGEELEFLMFDGSIRRLTMPIEPQSLLKLITPDSEEEMPGFFRSQ